MDHLELLIEHSRGLTFQYLSQELRLHQTIFSPQFSFFLWKNIHMHEEGDKSFISHRSVDSRLLSRTIVKLSKNGYLQKELRAFQTLA